MSPRLLLLLKLEAFAGPPCIQNRESQPTAPATHPTQTVASILDRHIRFLGGRQALEDARDLELRGELATPVGTLDYRGLVRRDPFAFREEISAPSPGGPCWIRISDGERAWTLESDGSGKPMPAGEAISVLDYAFFAGLLYPHEEWSSGMIVSPPWQVTELLPPGRGMRQHRQVDVITLRTPTGVVWSCFFDAEDGRLHGIEAPFAATNPWARFGEWKTWGPLTLPSLIMRGQRAAPERTATLTISEVRTRLRHAPDLFAGNPARLLSGIAPASRLLFVRSHVPGSCYFVLPTVLVDSQGPIVTIIDTGASHPCLRSDVAAGLGLHVRGRGSSVTNFGSAVSLLHWIDSIDLGEQRLIQLRATSMEFPSFAELGREETPGLILGGKALLEAAPLLDLERRTLFFRGQGVSLADTAPAAQHRETLPASAPSPAIVSLPLRRQRPRSSLLCLDVGVEGRAATLVLDTGLPVFMRLTEAGLRRLGLPTAPADWFARGAVPQEMAGAGGTFGVDLLVRLDGVLVGPVLYQRPWVLLAGLGKEDRATKDLPYEGMLGAGALLPFRRVAIDGERLELLAGPDLQREPSGRILVPDPGEFLGFKLGPPEPLTLREPNCFPFFAEVAAGSVASRAGIAKGDFLTAINGIPCVTQVPAILYQELWVPRGKQASLTVRKADGRIVVVRLP